MAPTKRSGRETWLDGLKGFAILLVVLGHVLSGYLDADTFPDAYWSFYQVRTLIYSFHMPLFFLLSGFTFTLAYWQDGRLRKAGYLPQLGNLLWIYVIFALAQWGIKQVVPELVNESYDLEDLRRMFVEPLGNFWYLYVLLVLYLLGGVLRVPNWKLHWLLLPGALAIVAADTHLDWTELTGYRIVYHFFFFGVGCALCRERRLLSGGKPAGIAAMLLSVAGYLHLCWGIWSWYGNWKLGIALSASYLLVVAFFRWKRLSGCRLLQLCGRYCLEIYLLHTFFTAGLRTVLPRWGVVDPWISVWVNSFLSTALCLLLAYLAGKASWTDLIFRPARFFRRHWRSHTK